MLKRIVVLPYLVGIYFVLDGFIQFASYIPLKMIFLPLGLVLAIILILNLILSVIIKDRLKSGMIVAVSLIPLLFCAKFLVLFRDISYRLERIDCIVAVTGILTALAIIFIIRTKKRLMGLNFYLCLLFILYIIYGTIMLFINVKRYDYSLESKIYRQACIGTNNHVVDLSAAPDIYYLIFDSYTSSTSLKNYWDYDNSDFLAGLKGRGFYIAQDSLSFGVETLSSMSSTFNMANDSRLSSAPEEIKLKLIENNFVAKYLKSQGYEFINLSPFNIVGNRRFYEYGFIGYAGRGGSYFCRKIFNGTMISQILLQLNHAYVYRKNAQIIDSLKRIPSGKQDKPRFVYAHLMLPHRPFCFDHAGKFIPWFKQGAFDKQAYLEQLIYTNQAILNLVGELLSKSRKLPIIIIQGDHGFRFTGNINNYERESVTIMNAYLFPGRSEGLVYRNISPFNTFRVVFNYYFGQNYKLLQDKTN